MKVSRRNIPVLLVVTLMATSCSLFLPPRRPVPPVPEPFLTGSVPTLTDLQTAALRGRRICIDPGHGGAFAGAVSPGGLREADVNLDVALDVWGLLNDAGAVAFMTRWGDEMVAKQPGATLRDDLQARAELARTGRADMLISIHHNADVSTGTALNDLKVFYNMEDEGASLDIAQSLVQTLAVSPSPDADRQKLVLPGNFRVLREAPCPAVLTEASYMTSASNERMLVLAEYRRGEARAIVAGLANYFMRGCPSAKWTVEPGSTMVAGDILKSVLEPGNGSTVDPTTVRMVVDNDTVPHIFDPDSRTVVAVIPPLSEGEHKASLRFRNTNGNACDQRPLRFLVNTPPRHLVIHTEPSTLPASGPAFLRVVVRALDENMFPSGDGRHVSVTASVGSVEPETVTLANGTAVVHCTVPAGTDSCTVRGSMDGLDTVAISLDRDPNVSTDLYGKVTDARTMLPVAGATVVADSTTSDVTDSAGYFILDTPSAETVRVTLSGYRPTTVSAPATGTVIQLDPISYSSLAGLRVAIDPQFGGTLPGRISPTGVRAADINLRVAEFLASYLETAGADPLLVRTNNSSIPQLNRVSLANQFSADIYIEIGHGAPTAADVGVLDKTGHLLEGDLADVPYVAAYPTSKQGNRCAGIMARKLETLVDNQPVRVVGSSATTITHTACPAVAVHVAEPHDEPTSRMLTDPSFQRREACTILFAIAEWAGLDHAKCGSISGTILRDQSPATGVLVTLNDWLSLQTDSSGMYHFSMVPVGVHKISVTAAGENQLVRSVRVRSLQRTGANFTISSGKDNDGINHEPVQ